MLDASNFGQAVRGVDGEGARLRGGGANREVKVNAAGYEKAAEIVTGILEAGE